MERSVEKPERISVRDWALALATTALSVVQAARVRQPRKGVVLGGNAEELATVLRREVGGRWEALGDGETRPWVLLQDGWKRLKRYDVVVVQAVEEDGREPLWTCSGLAEIFRQPEGRAFVIGLIRAETAAVRSWVEKGAWGLLDAAVNVAGDGVEGTARGVREALRGI